MRPAAARRRAGRGVRLPGPPTSPADEALTTFCRSALLKRRDDRAARHRMLRQWVQRQGAGMALSTWLSLWDDLQFDCGREGLFVDAVSPSYKGYRYPAEVIAHCVWLYHRFPLSFREAGELMPARGAIVSCETIAQWCAKFGPAYARALRASPAPGRGQVAPGQGLRDDQRRGAPPVAGSRPGRQRPGHPDPKQAGREGRQAVPAQADEQAVPHAAGPGHRQATQLRRRPPRDDPPGGTPPIEAPEQPGGELPPAHPAARTRDEGLPLTRRGSAVPLGLQRDLAALPTPAATASPHRNTAAR